MAAEANAQAADADQERGVVPESSPEGSPPKARPSTQSAQGDEEDGGARQKRTRCFRIMQQDMYSASCPLWFYTQGAQWKCSACLAIWCLVWGGALLAAAGGIVEVSIAYDHNDVCTTKTPRGCLKAFTLDTDIPGPAYMYYELPDIFVNHRAFVQSKDLDIWKNIYSKYYCTNAFSVDEVLAKRPGDKAFQQLTEGLVDFRPCGFTALSIFTDTYQMYRGNDPKAESMVTLDSSEVALTTDWTVYERKVVKVDGQRNGSSVFKIMDSDEVLHDTFLRDGDWLQHFQVWMRSPASPFVRNLWAVVKDGIPKGSYTLQITENSPIWTTDWLLPEKRVVLSHASMFGGGSSFLGILMVLAGVYFSICVVFFLVAERFAPKREGPVVGKSQGVKGPENKE